MSSPIDVIKVKDAASQHTTNERLVTSASELISNYILAKLLGTSPARLPTDVILPSDIDVPLDVLRQLPHVPFPVVQREVTSRLVSPQSDLAASVEAPGNKSINSDVDDAGTSQMRESVDSAVDRVHRVPVDSHAPVDSLHRRRHRLDVNKVEETLMEWNGERGKAHSVSNAAANLVVFAPLSPRRAAVVPPTAASVTSQLSPSTAPNRLSALRAIFEKSLGQESDETGSKETAVMTGNDSRVSGHSELEAFKSGPSAADMVDEQVEDIGVIAQDEDRVIPVTGFHLRPRLFPGSSQPRGHSDEPDTEASISLLLPPDNDPWTLSDDLKPTSSEMQLLIGNDDQEEEAVMEPTAGGHESKEEELMAGDSESNIATTDPTVYMYTVLSAATWQSNNDERDVIGDVRDDVERDVEHDVGYDEGDKVGRGDGDDDDREKSMERESMEVSSGNETSQSAVDDVRRLSPEFLRVMMSLWPGLEICAGPQCSQQDMSDAVASSSDVDDEATGLRRSTDYDLSTASTELVTTPTLSGSDVNMTSRPPATTPSWWEVRGSTSLQPDTTTTSPFHEFIHRLAGDLAVEQLMATRRQNVRLDLIATANSDGNMMSGKDKDHPEGLTTTVTLRPTTTESGVQLVDNMHDRDQPGQHRQQVSPIASSRSDSRPTSIIKNRPTALSVPGIQRLNGLVRRRGRPFHLHPRRVDPTRREKYQRGVRQRPFRQRYGFLPPIFSFHRNPTIVKPQPDVHALPERRRVQIVDEDSGFERDSVVVSQTNEETHLGHPGLPFNTDVLRRHSGLAHNRMVIYAPQDGDHQVLLEKTTTSTLAKKLENGIGEVNGKTGLPATITDGGVHETTGSDKTESKFNNRTALTVLDEDQQEITLLEQSTHSPSSRASLSSSSTTARGPNISDVGNKTLQFSDMASKVQVSPSLTAATTDVVTSVRSSTHSETMDFGSTTSTSSQQHHNDRQQTMPQVPLTSTSELPVDPDPLHTGSFQTTAIRPLSVDSGAVSPGGGEPLPVQARPGEHDDSAAAIEMFGGYADWMVGLISAVAVAVFIFLAILSFLAVVSCRCVSSR